MLGHHFSQMGKSVDATWRRALGLIAIAALFASRAVALGSCTGDCDRDNRVTVNEVVTGVQIALGNDATASCPAFECRPGDVQVDCLLKGVKNALRGCPPADAAWLSYVLCRQCEPCMFLTINELIALQNGTLTGISPLPDEILPPGVEVFDVSIDLGVVACAACGCPLAVISVLVGSADGERLREIGWF